MPIEVSIDEINTYYASCCSVSLALHVLSFFCMIGAGSYGHFQASKSGVNKGDLKNPLVKAGFVATRISVSVRFSVVFDILVMLSIFCQVVIRAHFY